jgi:hypothetical protein
MVSYLNSLRHRLAFCFQDRQPDGEGGWLFAPLQKTHLWGSLAPLASSSSESTAQSSLKAGHQPIFLKGERYEVIVRTLELKPHLAKPLAWIQWDQRRLYPLGALRYTDDKQAYLSVHVVARRDVAPVGGEA